MDSAYTAPLGQRIHGRRNELGWSQAELAKRAGVSQGTIAQLETAAITRTKHLVEIAHALGVSSEWLASGRGDKEQSATIDRNALHAAISGVFEANQSLQNSIDGDRFAEVCVAVYEELQESQDANVDPRALAGAVFRMTRS
ncbi:MAG: helix-turn-helix transcriptional regulator [Rhodospirillales bacterium]|nr:helix-turn-helix transcriptional regulator [Rhodospirillales bacterium]